MSLIDTSYFVGELTIPGTNRTVVADRLNDFITKHESELLERILGIDLYLAFKSGLVQPSVEQRWTNLLSGTIYAIGSRNKRWRGIISQVSGGVDAISPLEVLNNYTVIIGRGQTVAGGYPADDPISGSSSVLLPDALIGQRFIVVQRGFGELRSDEYTVVGNLLTLNNWTFSSGDTYFYKSATLSTSVIESDDESSQESFITNYVYCKWMRANATQTTPMGEVGSKTENADNVSASDKIQRASYEMDRWVVEMYDYLTFNYTVYPEWKHLRSRPLGANAFGI